MKRIYSCVVLVMTIFNVAHAYSILPLKHVIANTTRDQLSYDFHFLENPACDSTGTVPAGQVKELHCASGGVFKSGRYAIDFEQSYFYGTRKVRCTASITERVVSRSLALWKLSKQCQMDVIES